MSFNNENICLKNGKIIHVKVRISDRARNISIKILSSNIVELVIPKKASYSAAKKFLLSKESWIRANIKEVYYPGIVLEDQAIIPILGDDVTIHYTNKLRGLTRLEETYLLVHGPQEYLPRKVKQFLYDLLYRELEVITAKTANILKVKYKKIQIKDTSSRWASCSSIGNLSFCWKLVFTPKEIIEYIVAHEVAHLIEMNHSQAFWAIVAQLYPDYKNARKWLKENSWLLGS
jgi:predicted metal-dependent hydrolase